MNIVNPNLAHNIKEQGMLKSPNQFGYIYLGCEIEVPSFFKSDSKQKKKAIAKIKEYCACMMDAAAKVYPSPDEASWAKENDEEEFYATIIQYGVDDCFALLIKMMMELEQLEGE